MDKFAPITASATAHCHGMCNGSLYVCKMGYYRSDYRAINLVSVTCIRSKV